MDYAIQHVNDDHGKEMVQIVQVYADFIDVAKVTLLDYDASGMELLVVQTEKGAQKTRIPFPKGLNRPNDFRQVLVEMVKVARKRQEK